MRKWVGIFAILMFGLQTYAEKVKVNGLYYNLVEKAGIAEVTFPSSSSEYSGDIVIPDSIEYDGLKYVVAVIGDNAFTSSRVNSVNIPTSIKTIKRQAFAGSYLKYFYISDLEKWCNIDFADDCINSDEHHIILNGNEINELMIPDGIETIPSCAFNGCIGITTVIIPYGVKKIGRSTFNHCENLSIIEIPNSITSIGEGAFRACNFEFFSFPNGNCDLEMFVLCACPNLKSVKFPDSVKEISAYCCKFCPELTTIWIGNNVTKIQYEAFAVCPKLRDVYCNARDVPDTKDEVPFRDSYIEFATLHVPANSIDKYKADPEFGRFGNIVAITDDEMNIDGTQISEKATIIYSLDGVKHDRTQRGVNILKMEDGKVKKVYYK